MSPPFIFRIDEIQEHAEAAENFDTQGHWIPSTDENAHEPVRTAGVVTGSWWYCDGQQIYTIGSSRPSGSHQFKTITMYYCAGLGFWILNENALTISNESWQTWHPLRFTHADNDYSSHATGAGDMPTLRMQRSDQTWPRLLLPDIYHAPQILPDNQYRGYGGLNGELPILLALVAFSTSRERLRDVLPMAFQQEAWQTHNQAFARIHQRGVVVRVYTAPNNWNGGSTSNELSNYESGNLGNYYN